ncbi:zinc carboxypeptidase domain-containing protein [Phthorimaea operculella]|nr:zinc carboxypeptidase domain-containing protein [Phthorimaea operculella]
MYMLKILDGIGSLGISGTNVEILVAPDKVEEFERVARKNKLQIHLSTSDFETVRDRCNGTGTFSWTAYYNVADIHEYLRNMSNIYPEWVKVVSAGKSYEGRELLGIQIKTPGTNNKPIMFIESGIHASERIGPATTTYFINQLLTSSHPGIQAMREEFEWHIFPTVNPDGYQYACDYDIGWRKTRSKSSNGCYGTDPNRNWDYNWMKSGGSDDPCSDHYSGTKPFSEEETRNLARYVSGLKNLTSYIAFHSDAQMILIPYSDTKKHEDNYNDMVQIGNLSIEYGYQVNKARYDGPGTAAELLYSASGVSMDWVKHTMSTPLVLLYELRGLNFGWPASRIPEQGDEVTQMLLGLVKGARMLGYFE